MAMVLPIVVAAALVGWVFLSLLGNERSRRVDEIETSADPRPVSTSHAQPQSAKAVSNAPAKAPQAAPTAVPAKAKGDSKGKSAPA